MFLNPFLKASEFLSHLNDFFLSPCSGSHFNPPFTIAIWLCGGLQLTMVVPYLISQIIGGVLGAAMSKV